MQKERIGIGSSIPPVVSDLFLAKCDRNFNIQLHGLNIVNIFRYIDDCLVLDVPNNGEFTVAVESVLDVFIDGLSPRTLTHELSEENKIWYLDLCLQFDACVLDV